MEKQSQFIGIMPGRRDMFKLYLIRASGEKTPVQVSVMLSTAHCTLFLMMERRHSL